MSTALVWFRNDLRLADNSALHQATQMYDTIVPVFVLDDGVLRGRHASANRQRFLQESLTELNDELTARGGRLIVLHGQPGPELIKLARIARAQTVLAATDYSPYAKHRDTIVTQALQEAGIGLKWLPGRLMLDDPLTLVSGSGKPYQIFTPFYNAWLNVPRRTALPAPSKISMPDELSNTPDAAAALAVLANYTAASELSPDVQAGGALAAHKCLNAFLAGPIEEYATLHDDLAANATSHLSAYLHFGCISPREIEAALPGTEPAEAFRRQLAWRDFYHYVLASNPQNSHQEFQARYRGLVWSTNPAALKTWQTGHTGYPVVDAAMRELLQTGYMHNRARLIVGSFLTKDLGLDWREGERHFMRYLTDGDQANNNGNWQWIASVGVDPAPLFRRLYNPTTQAERYDPAGAYIRRHVPELAQVPLEHLYEPWKMTLAQQQAASCLIGRDYPAPIVDHALARQAAIERYRAAGLG